LILFILFDGGLGFKDYCDVDRGWVFLLSQVGSENECKYLSNLYVFDIYEKKT